MEVRELPPDLVDPTLSGRGSCIIDFGSPQSFLLEARSLSLLLMALVLECNGAARAPQKADHSMIYVMLFIGLCSLSLASCGVSPVLNTARTQEGIASYYSSDFQGRKTSSGEKFDNFQLTAAHRSFPFGTLVRVTNLSNQQQVEVRINDRGPRKPERIIDLSLAAARAIDMERAGLAHVRVEVLEMGQ